MADTGGFRTKFGGFNKEDVLAYIDSLQEEHARQLAAVQQQADAQREAYEKALNDANTTLAEQFCALQEERAEQEKLQQLINEQYEANRTLREQAQAAQTAQKAVEQAQAQADEALAQAARAQAEAERLCTALQEAQAAQDALRAEADAQTEEVATLRQQLAESEAARTALQAKQSECDAVAEELAATKAQLSEMQNDRTRLADHNGRYQQLVGDVGSFVVEVRGMGQRFLEDANTRCQSRLTAISGAIAALSEQLTATAAELSAADESLTAQNSAAQQRLEELARELETSVADMVPPTPVGDAPARFF